MRNNFPGLGGAVQHTAFKHTGKQDRRPHCTKCGEVISHEQQDAHAEKLCADCLTARRDMSRRVYGHQQPDSGPQRIIPDAATQLRTRSNYPRKDAKLSKGFRPTF